ncbi:MAG TPA: glycoside hydrolase family 3 C-terminal domain-containing protein [Ruminiclostridium sp.]
MKERLPYQDGNLSFTDRAKDLVSKMTLDEKISQMLFSSPSINHLEIPSYNWWNEALHGVARAGVATMFPQAIGMAATFDDQLIYKVADIISTEGRAKYHEFQRKDDHGIYKGLTFWSPTINIFRDPRWGRGQETYGEDPYLTGKLGVAYVKGLQGNDEKYLKTAACAKHFAVHSGPESDRHSFDAIASPKDMRETYLYAFKELVKEAKVAGVMGAYNRTNGEPCCGSKTLLQDILRDEWGFDGYVTSDCWAIQDFHLYHMVTNNAPESVALAVKNGCDLNCGSMFANLLIAIEQGFLKEQSIDEAVIRLLTIRMRLGMFDNPDLVSYTKIPYILNDCAEHNIFSLEVAKRSLVLLKNENNILPLNKEKINTIAIIGPNADSRDALQGNYYGTASRYKTVIEGFFQTVNKNTRVMYAQGCHLHSDRVERHGEPNDRIAEAISVAESADVVVMCVGYDARIEGEEGYVSDEVRGDKQNLDLPGEQQKLLEAVYKTGKPIVLVVLTGGPLALTWADEHIPAIIQAWYPGALGGEAVASMILGEYSPSGKLPVTVYKSDEELPDFADYSMKNRTYRYMTTEPLYPFGFGLSYTKFEYSELSLSSGSIITGDSIKCTAKVENIGQYDSVEIVQLYLKRMGAGADAAIWQLWGCEALHLATGEVKDVDFLITARQMASITEEGICVLEAGQLKVFVGGSQPDERSYKLTGNSVLNCEFEVMGDSITLDC